MKRRRDIKGEDDVGHRLHWRKLGLRNTIKHEKHQVSRYATYAMSYKTSLGVTGVISRGKHEISHIEHKKSRKKKRRRREKYKKGNKTRGESSSS